MVDLETAGATMLLIHNGELADVRELLAALGLGFTESTPRETATQDYLAAPIVISGPEYLSSRLVAGDVGSGVRIAIIEDDSKTLVAMLSRDGVEWIVRRPFHPAALRLLLLHCLYLGPEKRVAKRVSIGAAVHFQVGWRKRGALLAEISERDCRILSSKTVNVGRRLKLRLPAELAGRRVLHLDGRVVRTAQSQKADGSHEIGILFDPLPAAEAVRLKDLVSAHSRGPAVLQGAAARHLVRNRPSDPEDRDRGRRSIICVSRPEPDGASQPASKDIEDSASGDAAKASERRMDPRHEYQRRVIALSHEATRVLVGRDISRHGMRVDPTPNLEVGSALQIALHVPGSETPLVVGVRVHRDDGERGVVLHFVDMPQAAADYLDDLLRDLAGPSGSADSSSSADQRIFVVSEIVSEVGSEVGSQAAES